jgi:hypothetical protein
LIPPDSSSGTPSTLPRWRVTQWVLLGAIAVAAVVQQVQVSWLARTVTNDDATLLWYSAQEWASRQVRQPGFYGQSYGSTLEGLPLDALARLGLEFWIGLPVVMGVFAIAGWSLLAIAAWRRSHRVLAAAALVAPVLLSGYYAFFVTTVPTWTAPRFLAVTGVALLVMPRLPRPIEALAFSVLGLGVVMDPSNALLGVPVVLWFLLSQRVTRDRVVTFAAAAVIPAAWFVWSWAFFRAHPDYDLHGALSLRPSWDVLSHSAMHLGSFFDLFTPELTPPSLVPAGAFIALVAVLVTRRRAMYVAPAIGAFVLLLWGMTTPKADPFASLGKFLPQGRLLLMLPYLLWFLALLVVESGALARIRVPTRAALAVLTAVALVSLGARVVSGSVADVRDESVSYGRRGLYSFGPVENIRSTCTEVHRAAEGAGASIAVFVRNRAKPNLDRALAYGCGALAYGRMDTLEPDYERRTWRLYDELHRTRTSAVLWGVKPGYCGYARWRVEQCGELQPGIVALTFERQSVLVLLSSLEIPVRPFGPDCAPKLDLAAIGCDDPLELPPHELVTGPPPADPNLAKALIEAAFARVFETGAARRLVNVEGEPPLPDPVQEELAGMSAPEDRVETVQFLDPRQALVQFQMAADNSPSDGSTLTGRAVLVDGTWVVTRDTFCRDTFVSGLGRC